MSSAIFSSIVAYLLTTLCALYLLRLGANWRIRFLTAVVGLMPICQTVILLRDNFIWIMPQIGRMAELVELLVSGLCLMAIYLLNKEIRDRRNTDVRLRLAESEIQKAPVSTSLSMKTSEVNQ